MKRTTTMIAAAATALLIAFVLAASASAGTYTVTQCDSTFGVGTPDAQAFDQTGGDRYREQDFCFNDAQGGGLLAFHPSDGGATQGGTAAGWFFLPPPSTQFVGIEVVAGGARGAGDDYIPELLAVPPIAAPIIGNQLVFASPLGAETVYRWDPSQPGNGTGFTMQMRCARLPDSPNCGTGDGNFLNLRRINLTVADGAGPQLANAGSSLSSSSSQRGVLNASYAATDAGAGIRAVSASVNGSGGGEVASSCSVTSGRAVRLAPCPGSVNGSIPLDTTQAPWRQGLNQTRFCAVEYADSNAGQACSAGPDVRVDNACPVNGTQGVVGFEQLRFEGGKAGDGRTVYGSSVKLTGRAVDANDQPVAGAELCLGEQIDLGPYTPESIVRNPTTNRKGRFALGIPSGPSRVFRLAQWQTSGPVVEQFMSLQVKAKPQLAVRPKGKIREGKKTRLRVKVNRPVAPGQTVAIQAQTPTGYVTIPACQGAVDADGRLTCKDRLPDQPGPAAYTIRYRAVAPHVEGSAYLPGTSKPITKRVKG
jgi:hypothetical protein